MYKNTFEVRGFDKTNEKDDGTSWGLFHNESIANIMLAELSRRFGTHTTSFYVKELNPKSVLTGIDRKFKEAEIDADYQAMDDYYNDHPERLIDDLNF
tara:strand:+ start:359 stop:652 length:294 start_codon:yes stop_codon:yes gene_type:complete